MGSFSDKFGMQPISVTGHARVLTTQAVVVLLLALAMQPSFLQDPTTSEVSLALCALFACLVVAATIVVHRSFIDPA